MLRQKGAKHPVFELEPEIKHKLGATDEVQYSTLELQFVLTKWHCHWFPEFM
jgi:hypothetical protein